MERLLASRRLQRQPRGRHGRLLSEATDPALKGEWKVPLPKRDFAAATLTAAIEQRKKAWPNDDYDSLIWAVER